MDNLVNAPIPEGERTMIDESIRAETVEPKESDDLGYRAWEAATAAVDRLSLFLNDAKMPSVFAVALDFDAAEGAHNSVSVQTVSPEVAAVMLKGALTQCLIARGESPAAAERKMCQLLGIPVAEEAGEERLEKYEDLRASFARDR